jgi:predicted phosphate transport protein (TIGR00153 family)
MGLGFIKFFLPKDRVFYGLFEEGTLNLLEMSDVLGRALNEPDMEKRLTMLHSLDDLEHKNDDITHRIFIQLGQNFITPFDREDIHALATALDDVADYTWGSAKRMINYHMEEADDVMRNFATIIRKSIEALHLAVSELRNMKNLRSITDSCVAINSLENEADELLDKGIGTLFASAINAVELIKKKDLYEELELVTDKCEDAANVIESIIIKYA